MTADEARRKTEEKKRRVEKDGNEAWLRWSEEKRVQEEESDRRIAKMLPNKIEELRLKVLAKIEKAVNEGSSRCYVESESCFSWSDPSFILETRAYAAIIEELRSPSYGFVVEEYPGAITEWDDREWEWRTLGFKIKFEISW